MVFTEINRQLDEARQGKLQLQKLESMLQHLLQEKADLEGKVVILREKLTREEADVQLLEKMSLASIFYSALGNLAQRTEKERQEALAARLKYQQAVRDLDDVQKKIALLRSRRRENLVFPHRYQALYVQKKEMLIKSGCASAQDLMNLTEEANKRKNILKEIEEAVAAGREVLTSLDRVLGSLGKARNWGVWDVMGGGLLADLAKHSHIDDARAEASRTQVLLRNFNTELADVQIHGSIRVETGGFAKFADFFFDGLIADFVMQSKITNARDSVARVRSQVNAALEQLRAMDTLERRALARLNMQIDALIVES